MEHIKPSSSNTLHNQRNMVKKSRSVQIDVLSLFVNTFFKPLALIEMQPKDGAI